MGIPPHWQSYVTVVNFDDAPESARNLSATLMAEPFDVMTAGRMAVIQDPGGAVFNVWQPVESIGAEIANTPGALCWNELLTRDIEGSKAFYTSLFGWSADTMDMGPMQYTIFKNGDRPNGGMLEIDPEWGEVPPHWMVYLSLEDCDASVEQVGSLGGRIFEQPRDIPEVGRTCVASDPQGAAFALIKVNNSE